jgi:hypothetical protein
LYDQLFPSVPTKNSSADVAAVIVMAAPTATTRNHTSRSVIRILLARGAATGAPLEAAYQTTIGAHRRRQNSSIIVTPLFD